MAKRKGQKVDSVREILRAVVVRSSPLGNRHHRVGGNRGSVRCRLNRTQPHTERYAAMIASRSARTSRPGTINGALSYTFTVFPDLAAS